MASKFTAKQATWTSRVHDALRAADDFRSFEQLLAATGANRNQLSAALFHLHKRKVVESIESGGKLWWFITGDDDRLVIVEQRTPEEPGTRRRKKVNPADKR